MNGTLSPSSSKYTVRIERRSMATPDLVLEELSVPARYQLTEGISNSGVKYIQIQCRVDSASKQMETIHNDILRIAQVIQHYERPTVSTVPLIRPVEVMKQVQTCMDRVFEGKKPHKANKWKAYILDDILYVYNYQHLSLKFDIQNKEVVYKWYEKRADKRGLVSVLLYLEQRYAITLF